MFLIVLKNINDYFTILLSGVVECPCNLYLSPNGTITPTSNGHGAAIIQSKCSPWQKISIGK